MKNNKQLLKNILIVIALMAALYLIYIFVGYWDIAADAFREGWKSA